MTDGATRAALDAAARKEALRRPWTQLAALLDRAGVDLVFDIGAHLGEFAGYLRREGYEGRIVSFEPQSAVHARLQEAADGDERWTVAPRMAIGERIGRVEINLSAETDMSSILPLSPHALAFTPTSRMVGREPAALTTLAEIFDRYATPDDTVFVKADTQGYEPQVLAGAGPVMERIVGWQLELSLEPIYEGEADWRRLVDQMGDAGYAAALILPGYFSRHLGRMLQADFVFMREAAMTR